VKPPVSHMNHPSGYEAARHEAARHEAVCPFCQGTGLAGDMLRPVMFALNGARLNPQEGLLLAMLRQSPGVLVPKRELFAALSAAGAERDDPGTILTTVISRLRTKIAGSGERIENQKGYGYALISTGAGHRPAEGVA